MFKMQSLFTLVALFVNVAHSWDFAVTVKNQIEFYGNGTKTNTEGVRFGDLTALAYDAVHNMLLFVDRQNDNASIFSYHLATKQYQPLVRKRPYQNIQGLAFDPVQRKLFWTDVIDKSIYWVSLKPGAKNNEFGNLLIKLDDEFPRAIAVDSCREYIYWTNTNVKNKPSIERAKFDGSDRKIVVNTDIYMPISISIDQRTKRLYWADDKEGIHYSIESSDLEGKDRQTIVAGTHHQPNALTVSKDSLYWVDWGYRSVWHLAKDKQADEEPLQISNFTEELPFGVVANYRIEDQMEGVEDCKLVKDLLINKPAVISETFNIPRDLGVFCLHGTVISDDSGKFSCNCSLGYSGVRCEVFNCQNFCVNGECSVSGDGSPQCRCSNGYTGNRCEINVCTGFCLNAGICAVDENNKPSCTCSDSYEGNRCENIKTPNDTPKTVYIKETCNCSKTDEILSPMAKPSEDAKYSEMDMSKSSQIKSTGDTMLCDNEWDSIRDPILMVLGILCGLLCIVCALLVTKVMQLKKRPRIKKRIIVNKSVTPLTARPDSCEITIENCCNMNICETPCFEPRSTIRPNLLEAKPGKEEKKNLIANMEYPEDY